MNTIYIEHEMYAFGLRVHHFPEEIGKTFDQLSRRVAGGNQRSGFGLSRMDNDGSIIYYAALEERSPDEARLYDCERFVLPKGEYLSAVLKDWPQHLDGIKSIFEEMMKDKRFDTSAYCIEWYQSETEMLCLLQLDTAKAAISEIQEAGSEMDRWLDQIAVESVNLKPKGSGWSPAQVVEHVTRSNRAMSGALEMQGALADRDPGQRREELRSMFMNFETKFTSPAFIEPEDKIYDKAALQAAFRQSVHSVLEKAGGAGYATMINLPGFGPITKLELLYFVGYHTRRHIHQLQKLATAIETNGYL